MAMAHGPGPNTPIGTVIDIGAGKIAGILTLQRLGKVGTSVFNTFQGLIQQVNLFNVVAGGLAYTVGSFLVRSVVGMTKQTMGFQDILADLQRVTEESTTVVNQLGESFLNLSATLPIAAGELAKAAVVAGQLGVPAKYILGLTEAASKFAAVAEGISTERAMRIIATTAQVFRASLGEAMNIASAFTAANIRSIASVEEIFQAMRKFGSVAGGFGVTAAEAVALGSAIRQAGETFEVAGTAINKTLLEMHSRTAMFSQFLGMVPDQFQELLRTNPTEVLVRFTETLDRAQDSGMDLMTLLRGLGLANARFYRAFLALSKTVNIGNEAIAKGAFDLRTQIKYVSEQFKDAADVERQFMVRSQSLEKQLEILKNGFDALRIKMGEGLTTAFSPLIRVANILIQLLNVLPTPLLAIVGVGALFAGISLKIAGALLVIAGVLPAVAFLWRRYNKEVLRAKTTGGLLSDVLRAVAINLNMMTGSQVLANTQKLDLIFLGASLHLNRIARQLRGLSPYLSGKLMKLSDYFFALQKSTFGAIDAHRKLLSGIKLLFAPFKLLGKVALNVFTAIIIGIGKVIGAIGALRLKFLGLGLLGKGVLGTIIGAALLTLPSLFTGLFAGLQDFIAKFGQSMTTAINTLMQLLFGPASPFKDFWDMIFDLGVLIGKMIVLPFLVLAKIFEGLVTLADTFFNRGKATQEVLKKQAEAAAKLRNELSRIITDERSFTTFWTSAFKNVRAPVPPGLPFPLEYYRGIGTGPRAAAAPTPVAPAHPLGIKMKPPSTEHSLYYKVMQGAMQSVLDALVGSETAAAIRKWNLEHFDERGRIRDQRPTEVKVYLDGIEMRDALINMNDQVGGYAGHRALGQ